MMESSRACGVSVSIADAGARRTFNSQLERAADTDPRHEFNLQLEPAIQASSGVKSTAVDSTRAAECAAFLQQQWLGSARLGLTGIYLGGTQCKGYASYPKTLLEHDAEEQASHTLLISSALLPLYREKCPGFEAMERELVAWLAEEFGVVAELANGHALRQSQETLRSTGFGVHQARRGHSARLSAHSVHACRPMHTRP